ncbi:MAG TPA: hypothetical protein VMR70_16620 [Flavisolibacter sp.]|nr:hypothetical protein [Flavisolibacter sp.]
MMSILLYVDPGSGSYLIQALVAAVTGFVFFFKNIRMYVRDKFQRLFRKKQS